MTSGVTIASAKIVAMLRPATAVAGTLVACDLFVLALSYRFYARRTRQSAPSGGEPLAGCG